MKEKKKKYTFALFPKFKTEEDVLKQITGMFWALFILGMLSIIIGIFLGTAFIIDGAVFVILATLLYFTKSRVVAVILAIVAGIGIISTILNALGVGQGGANVLLSILIFIYSIGSVRGTFFLHKLKKKTKISKAAGENAS